MKNKLVTLLSLLCALVFTGCLEEDVNNAIGTPSPIISLEDVRGMYKGNDITLGPDQMMGAHQILGVVISDAAGQNVPGGTSSLVIQNHRRGELRGITLNVQGGSPSYAIGDSVVVNVTGTTLTQRNGILQISGLAPTAITKVTSNAKVHVREVTLEDLVKNAQVYEGTLVRLVAGNVSPAPAATATFNGDKNLVDGGGKTVVLHTEPTASFANRRVYASASYTGIPIIQRGNGEPVVQLWLRSFADVKDPSGPIYAGFPESFEAVPASTKGSYNMTAIDNNITVTTGSWKLLQAILGNTSGRDRFTGQHGIRMQQQLTTDAYVQMNFDVPNGASKVTMLYGSYYTDPSSTWRLEYSQNQGTTWTQIGPTVTDASSTEKTAVFLMDLAGPVRFRIVKVGLGPTTTTVRNGRLCFDDIAVYQN